MQRLTLTLTATMLIGSIALAHSGVQNAQVMQRMNAMSSAAAATKVLGNMARGKTPYDATQAAAAKADLQAIAAEIPTTFRENAHDPKSEAAPAIWENYDDFSAKADIMLSAANKLNVSNAGTIGNSLAALGASCKGCHQSYRIKK